MKLIVTFLMVVLFAGLGVIGFAYSGLYDVSASSPHSGLTNWLLSTTSHASVERRAGAVRVPDLEDEALVLAGINDFDSMCIGCHGAPGKSPAAVGQGLNPPAPDLAKSAAEMTPAELFWVTKHGIKMTGMPAWGATHDDGSIWPVIAFMTKLPGLGEAGYLEMLNAAMGHGHHSDDPVTEEHGQAESDEAAGSEAHDHEVGIEHDHVEPVEPEVPTEHDHSTHKHNDD
jgi:mono/diheme cytochrome c family protein